MKYLTIITLIIILSLVSHSNQVSITLPVPQIILTKVALSIDKLSEILKNFNTRQQNKWEIYKRVSLTTKYLNQLKAALAQYNNIVAGNYNGVLGNKNFVIGNYNSITGSNNWVFVSKFTGRIDGDLLIGDWRIQLDKAKYILINPRFAISYLNEQRNKQMNEKYGKKKRSLLKLDKSQKIKDQKFRKFWQKYQKIQDKKKDENKKKERNLKRDEDSSQSNSFKKLFY